MRLIENRKPSALLVRTKQALPFLHARSASECVSAAVKVGLTRLRFVLVRLSLVAPFRGLRHITGSAGRQ